MLNGDVKNDDGSLNIPVTEVSPTRGAILRNWADTLRHMTQRSMGGTLGPAEGVSLAGLAFCLVIPSLVQVQKYCGNAGVMLYLFAVPFILWIGYRHVFFRVLPKINERDAFWLAVGTLIAILAVFVCLYPAAKSGIVGQGSDADNALNIATRALLRGRFPYYQPTYLGNPISPLPGSLLLAVPFVLLGNSAYQNLFWIAAFFVLAREWLESGPQALLLLWIILALSPVVWWELATGADLLSNSIYVLVLMLVLVRSIPKPNLTSLSKTPLSILVGISISSRANFAFTLPLVFSILVQSAGWKCAAKYTGLACLAAGAVTFPFYLNDPRGFTPIHILKKLSGLDPTLPHAALVMTLAMAGLALVLSCQRMDRSGTVLLRNCALLLSFPVLFLVLLNSIQARSLELYWVPHGTSFLFFGALASYMRLRGKGAETAQMAPGGSRRQACTAE